MIIQDIYPPGESSSGGDVLRGSRPAGSCQVRVVPGELSSGGVVLEPVNMDAFHSAKAAPQRPQFTLEERAQVPGSRRYWGAAAHPLKFLMNLKKKNMVKVCWILMWGPVLFGFFLFFSPGDFFLLLTTEFGYCRRKVRTLCQEIVIWALREHYFVVCKYHGTRSPSSCYQRISSEISPIGVHRFITQSQGTRLQQEQVEIWTRDIQPREKWEIPTEHWRSSVCSWIHCVLSKIKFKDDSVISFIIVLVIYFFVTILIFIVWNVCRTISTIIFASSHRTYGITLNLQKQQKEQCQWRIQDLDFFFLGGGGGQKILWAQTHHEREARSPLRPGSKALRGFDALSWYLSFIFEHSNTKGAEKIYIVDQNLGGGVAPSAPALNPPLYSALTWYQLPSTHTFWIK